MKTLDQQILSCMTVRLTERFPGLSPAFPFSLFRKSWKKKPELTEVLFIMRKTFFEKPFSKTVWIFSFSTHSAMCFFFIFFRKLPWNRKSGIWQQTRLPLILSILISCQKVRGVRNAERSTPDCRPVPEVQKSFILSC